MKPMEAIRVGDGRVVPCVPGLTVKRLPPGPVVPESDQTVRSLRESKDGAEVVAAGPPITNDGALSAPTGNAGGAMRRAPTMPGEERRTGWRR
jgi:hypothetical protein